MASKSNSNPFPSVPRYYVYFHRDPQTHEIVYVGHGCGARAWLSNEPFRSVLHSEYLGMLENTGYTPDTWVEIVDKGLTKEDACVLERRYIKKYKPEYNKIQGASLLKVTPEILEEAHTLRNSGWSYRKIADNFDLATMTIHRAMNGKNPALEEILERQP